MNNYNGETDYLKWYKKNYGIDYDDNVGLTRKEGMSDIDYQIGTKLKSAYDLNNAYQKNKETDLADRNKYYDEQVGLLQNKYGTAVDNLENNKRIAEQNASIGFDKLKKYLPTQINAQGLGGLGISESSMIQAHNNYNNQIGNIAGSYNSNKANLESDKISQISSLENYRQNNVNEINQKYSDYEQSLKGNTMSSIDSLYGNYLSEQEQLKQIERQEAYTVAQTTVEDLIYNQKDYTNAEKYLEANKSTFGDSVYTSYLTALNAEKQKVETAKKEEEKANTDTRILEGKEYVSYNGGSYKIKSQLNSDSNEIKRNNDFKKQLKDKCETTNPNDPNIPNGTTFAVKADNKGSNDFNLWDDVGAALMSPFAGGAWDSWGNWNTVYMTYYNGNWYKSDKK